MELSYREIGERGQALIIMHGVFGSSDNWLTLGKRFAEHYHVYLIDHRNHGRSGRSEDFTYPAMAEDLREFIGTHQLEKPIILGHSMGGKVAMLFALGYPQLYDRLIVADIAPRHYPVHHSRILEGLRAIPIDKLTNRNEAEEILSRYEGDPSVRQFLLKNLYREGQGFAWRINIPVISREIEKISIEIDGEPSTRPALFMRGLKSHYISDSDKPQIRRLFPLAQFAEFPNAGHWIHAEAPDDFYDSVMAFLQG